MTSFWADVLAGAGLLLTAIGAGRAAFSIWLSEDDALTIGVARYGGSREDNLKLPAVQNLLAASRGAIWGFALIFGGTILQIAPIVVRLLGY